MFFNVKLEQRKYIECKLCFIQYILINKHLINNTDKSILCPAVRHQESEKDKTATFAACGSGRCGPSWFHSPGDWQRACPRRPLHTVDGIRGQRPPVPASRRLCVVFQRKDLRKRAGPRDADCSRQRGNNETRRTRLTYNNNSKHTQRLARLVFIFNVCSQ